MDGDMDAIPRLLGGNADFRLRVAVRRRVFEDVAEYPRQLVRVGAQGQVFARVQDDGIAPAGKYRGQFVRQLREKEAEVDRRFRQLDLLGVVSGDFEELMDHFLQPVSLVQRDPHVFGTLRCRHAGGFLQQIEVADDRGEGGADVVGEVHHQFVLPLLGEGGVRFALLQGLLDGVELALKRQHFRGQLDLRPVVREQYVDSLIDFVEAAGYAAKDAPQQDAEYQKDRPAEKKVLVAAEMVAVKIVRLHRVHSENGFQTPYDQIPHAPFPDQQVQGRDDQRGKGDAAADAPQELEAENRVFVFPVSLQFDNLPPIPF